MENIFIEAQVKIVSTAKGAMLYPASTLIVEHALKDFPKDVPSAEQQKIFFAQIDTSVRLFAVSEFIKFLRENPPVKRRIGGTAWAVEIVGDVLNFPIYFERSDVGTINKFIKPGLWRRDTQIAQRNLALMHQIQSRELATA